jgi:hypothetical protein
MEKNLKRFNEEIIRVNKINPIGKKNTLGYVFYDDYKQKY